MDRKVGYNSHVVVWVYTSLDSLQVFILKLILLSPLNIHKRAYNFEVVFVPRHTA